MDIVVPSHNASRSSSAILSLSSLSSSSSSSSLRGEGVESESDSSEDDEDEGKESDSRGFLVHTKGCVIPDFDPFHHTVTRFISNPLTLTCKHPPALTSANGTTLYYHQNVLRDHLESFLKVYEQRVMAALANASSDNSSSSSSSNSTTTTSNATTSSSGTAHSTNSTSLYSSSSIYQNTSSSSLQRSFMSATPPFASPSSLGNSNEKNNNDDMNIYFDFSANSSEDKAAFLSFEDKAPPLTFDPASGVPKVKCCYRAIYRVVQKPNMYNAAADGRWKYSGWCSPLQGPKTQVREDSILVYCNMSRVVVYKNVHYFIQRDRVQKPSLPKSSSGVSLNLDVKYNNQNETTSSVNISNPHSNTTQNETQESSASSDSDPSKTVPREETEKLSVIIFGTDSASRLNMRRHLPKTYEYLTETLGAIDLTGFNKVGDNTFPNLVPVTIGLSHQELANHSCVPTKEKFDDCPWIWKDFKKNGYATAFIEDSPWMGMYNYMHNGFVRQPTDYYGRAFFLASEKEIGNEKHGNSNVCQADKLSLKVVQDYSLEVARTFLDYPTFSLYWSASVSHDYLNLLRHADLPHLDYLQQLKEFGALNHTALFFVSDHGMRWGSIRSTYVGMLEERLPYVLIYFPPWFREKYKYAFTNLKKNARRLTANYDLYETLYDLAYGRFANYSHVTSKPRRHARGISLFKAIHRGRRCDDAGIPGHFCTCQDTHDVPLTDPVLDLAAAFVKGNLNKELMMFPQCVRFTKIEILTGRVSRSNRQLYPQDVSSDVRSYLLQARLQPGDVVVEATLRYNPQPQVFQLTGEISRINQYGNTSHCVNHLVLRKFCFCKDVLEPTRPVPQGGTLNQTQQHQQQQKEKVHQQEKQQQQQQQQQRQKENVQQQEQQQQKEKVTTQTNEEKITSEAPTPPTSIGKETQRHPKDVSTQSHHQTTVANL